MRTINRQTLTKMPPKPKAKPDWMQKQAAESPTGCVGCDIRDQRNTNLKNKNKVLGQEINDMQNRISRLKELLHEPDVELNKDSKAELSEEVLRLKAENASLQRKISRFTKHQIRNDLVAQRQTKTERLANKGANALRNIIRSDGFAYTFSQDIFDMLNIVKEELEIAQNKERNQRRLSPNKAQSKEGSAQRKYMVT